MLRDQSDNLSVQDVFRQTGFTGKTALILATWFGSGFIPVASGTFGTLAAIPFVLLLSCLGGWYGAIALVVITAVAVWTSHRTQDLLGKPDPSEVVIDEVAGFSVTMFLLPLSWTSVGLGFILFRFFDIVKPWPVRQAEGLKGGLGIVADDLLAGVYAHLILRGILLVAA
jgi:phosphatidylglycerophosphatase A